MEPEQGHRNVLGQPLIPCSTEPLTGFYRNGSCAVGPEDAGCHAVCAEVTEDFAAAEGEGDGTLAYWRRVHWSYFGRECERLEGRPA